MVADAGTDFYTQTLPPRAFVSHLLLRFEVLRANLNKKTWAEINICFWTQCCTNYIRKSRNINRISRANFVRLLFVVSNDRGKFAKGRWTHQTNRSHFGCCWLHKQTWRLTQTNNTRSSYTSCKVQWGWRWDLGGTFIVDCNWFVV